MWSTHLFHQLGQIYCANDACINKDTRKWLPPMSRSQFTLLHDGFKTYLLPSAPERKGMKTGSEGKDALSTYHSF